MNTIFNRVSAMTADQRTALTGQFDKASRIESAEPVAVVGIGCRVPGNGSGPDGYWNFLADAGDGISEIPPDRWNADEFYDPDQFAPGRNILRGIDTPSVNLRFTGTQAKTGVCGIDLGNFLQALLDYSWAGRPRLH